jgi:hypothetical protein
VTHHYDDSPKISIVVRRWRLPNKDLAAKN